MIQVLIVEDNIGDVYLLKEALSAVGEFQFHVAGDGDMACAFLERRGEYSDAPRPDVVVLDLNLPGRDGPEVLDLIRRSPALADVPVAIVSSSPADALRRKAAHANLYLTKPADLESYLAIGPKILECYQNSLQSGT